MTSNTGKIYSFIDFNLQPKAGYTSSAMIHRRGEGSGVGVVSMIK